MNINLDKTKIILSGSWIVILFNYLYGDLAMMMFHADKYLKITSLMSEGIVLASAIFMEISIMMIILSLLMKYRINRWANIITGLIFAAFPIVTLFLGGTPPAFYIFLSVIEFLVALFIIVYSWRWENLNK
jgi:hypothetical protein